MKPTIVVLMVAASSSAPVAPGRPPAYVGTVTDDMCAKADHSLMQMGPNDAECTLACVSAHGAAYVLYDGKNSYTLIAREKLEPFAGQKVEIAGVLDAKTRTIHVATITRPKRDLGTSTQRR
jgi:hypothetical protein